VKWALGQRFANALIIWSATDSTYTPPLDDVTRYDPTESSSLRQ
jgi:hypothetical protein